MSVGFLVLVFTSIVDTVPLLLLATKAVLPSGVTATRLGPEPTGMSVGCLVLVFTSIVDTVPPLTLVTKAVLPSGVTATPNGLVPTRDVGGVLGPGLHVNRRHRWRCSALVTKAVARHARVPPPPTPRPGPHPPARPPTRAPTSPRTDWNRRITAPAWLSSSASIGPTRTAYAALWASRIGRTEHQPSRPSGCAEIDAARHSQPETTEVIAILTAQSHITADSGAAFDAP